MCAGAPVKRLGAIVESIAALLLAVVVVIVLVQVFGRYILRISLSWPEELARYVLVWLTFFGVAAAAASRSQIVVDTILELVSPRASRVLEGVAGPCRVAGAVPEAVLLGELEPGQGRQPRARFGCGRGLPYSRLMLTSPFRSVLRVFHAGDAPGMSA